MVELVDRSGRAIRLTPSGEGFLPLCVETLTMADNAVRVARNSGSVNRGVVRLGFPGKLSTATVASLARAVREVYPEIERRITASHSSSGIIALLQADRMDVGFAGMQRTVPSIATRQLSSQRLYLVASDHPLARMASVQLGAFSNAPFLLMDLASRLQLRDEAIDTCLDAGFRPRVVQEVQDTLILMALVAAGSGVTVLPSRFAEESPGPLAFLDLTDVERSFHTAVAWRSGQVFGALSRVLEVIDQQMPSLNEPGSSRSSVDRYTALPETPPQEIFRLKRGPGPYVATHEPRVHQQQ